MMKIFEDLKEILQYLRQYKARTAMTMFGIIWGTLTVIVLLAFGVGVKKQMSKNMHGMGEGIALVWPNKTSIPFEGYGRDRQIRLTVDDVGLIRSEIKDIKRISPEFHKWGSAIRRGEKINRPNVTGIIPEYGIMRNIWPEPGGRWLNEPDLELKRRVVFLGNRLRDLLFGENSDAIGQYVYIDEIPFLVIGVMREKTQPSSYSQRDQDRAFIPMTTHMSVFGRHYVNNIVYQIEDPRLGKEVRNQVYTVLGKRYKFDPKDTETLWIWDTTEFDRFIFYFSMGFTIFMGIIGAITLVVGGIGLANIMYVVVRERTMEIGIRRAVGAKRHHIMGQFIFETFIIIGLSALIGFTLASGIIGLMAALPMKDVQEAVGIPELNMAVALVTMLILGAVGFLAGYFPARKASRLDIVDCLRY